MNELNITSIAHVPGVFSHYGPRTGSALVTKVYNHARGLEKAGGTAYVVVNKNRAAEYDAGTVVRFASPREGGAEWYTEQERRLDALTGALVGRRPMQERFWRPAVRAVPRDVEAVVVYNQPSALRHGRTDPAGQLRILHLGNDVFRSWRPRHIASALADYDLVVAVSAFTACAINQRLPRGEPQVKVLRNGVDTDLFKPGSHVEVDYPEILFVGNPVPNKGAHHLLGAVRILADRGLRFRLRIVGSWGLSEWSNLTAYEEGLRRLAGPLGERIIFEPFVDRLAIAGVYRRARVFCMPVQWDEPAGQVVTEAMASGLPVVSARRGGIPEYLGPRGIYVDPENAGAFADALALYIMDPDAALKDGSELRRRAETMTWDTRVAEFDRMLACARR